MRIFKAIGLAAALFAGTAASATTVSNVGSTTKIQFAYEDVKHRGEGVFNFKQFIRNEKVVVTIDLTASTSSTLTASSSTFTDTNGAVTLWGLQSGTVINLSDFGGTGVEIRVTDGEFNITTVGQTGTILEDDGFQPTVFGSYVGGDDFATFLAVLASPNDFTGGTQFEVEDTGASGRGLIARDISAIPLPAGAWLLIGGLGALALRRKRA